MPRAKYELRDKVAIVGVGNTKIDRISGGGSSRRMALLGEAYKNALDDCGLTRKDIDGIIVHSVPAEATMDKFAEFLGTDLKRFAFQPWGHGRMFAQCITYGAMAIFHGLADSIALFSNGMPPGPALMRGAGDNPEANREGYGFDGQAPPWGNPGVISGAAFAARQYMHKYGYTQEHLGEVAVSMRKWANLNPIAYFHNQPLSLEDYMNSRWIVEPLKLYDCSLPAWGGFCIILTSADRARHLKKPPIYISGVQGAMSGRDQFVYGRQGLPMLQGGDYKYKAPAMLVYRMAGVKPEDVDMVSFLDSFSPLIPFCLELYGFCKDGEALGWIQGGRTRPGGRLPVNPSGGSLGEIYSWGWSYTIEMARQLRGEAAGRQIPDAEVAQFGCSDGASFILHK